MGDRLERGPAVRGVGLGVCALAPVLASCGAGDETPPELESARFEDASTVVLRFSEPLAPVDEVDPSSHFRLGVAFALDEFGYTVYYDLSRHLYSVPGQGDAADVWERHGLTIVATIEPGEDPAELRLSLSYPLNPYTCETLAEAAALDIPGGIHLHYAQAAHPRVVDVAGNPLADIAGWWLPEALSTIEDGAFPAMADARMPIPCPEF
ncbi:hypothetical protein ENSA5_42940 [Enhygromyxa salina]|uniref:Uncharacterized protein n=1 Tax=Enhygromyxa salina TaxID=215803 RepID=A0A2S9XKK7_9BACT|nr:hypothetical protein [Enhygromyxa salina]PRP93395.1 hypothetical protein ENSA5_42940 [Enhygromyxa salina]